MSPCHWSIKECGRFLKLVVEQLVLLFDYVTTSIVAICLDEWCLVPILFLVFPGGCQGVLSILELKVGLSVAQRCIDTNILPECLFKNPISAKLFIWPNQHLPSRPIILDQLEKWIILQRNAHVRVIEQDLISGKPSVLQLLHPLIYLLMNLLDASRAQVLKGTIN